MKRSKQVKTSKRKKSYVSAEETDKPIEDADGAWNSASEKKRVEAQRKDLEDKYGPLQTAQKGIAEAGEDYGVVVLSSGGCQAIADLKDDGYTEIDCNALLDELCGRLTRHCAPVIPEFSKRLKTLLRDKAINGPWFTVVSPLYYQVFRGMDVEFRGGKTADKHQESALRKAGF